MSSSNGPCLGVVVFIQYWAVKVVWRDTHFDLLSRLGFVIIVFLLPGPGFILVHHFWERAIHASEEAMQSSRARLGGSVR